MAIKYMLLLVLFPFSVLAKTIKTSEVKEKIPLDFVEHTVFEDSLQNYKIDEIVNLNDRAWKKANYYKNLSSVYWLKLEIKNDEDRYRFLLLELKDPHTDSIIFYKENQKLMSQGFYLPFALRPYQHKNHVFTISIAPHQTQTYFLKLHSNWNVNFATKLQSASTFVHYSLNEYFLLGIFYGFLIIMALYNLTLYVFTRMSIRLFYVLYVFACLLTSLLEDGLGFQYLWPSYPSLNHTLSHWQPITYLFCYTLYALSFFDLLYQKSRFKNQLITAIITYTILHFIFIYLELSPLVWLVFYIITFCMIFFYAEKKYRNQHRKARFLLLGTLLIIISYVLLYLRLLNVIENLFLEVYFFNFTVCVEIMLFSIAIGDKLRAQQIEHLNDKELIIESLKKNEELNDKVNKELEEKVSERTLALNKANKELEDQAQQITSMNLQLDLANRTLEKKMVEVSKKRIHGTVIDPDEFHELYPDKVGCYTLLEEIKWGNGFKCRNCGNESYNVGNSFRSRRCTKCGTTESPTAHTVFHGLRTPIEKAFYIFALVIQSKGEISSVELEQKTGVNQKACWRFRQKILANINPEKIRQLPWKALIFEQ